MGEQEAQPPTSPRKLLLLEIVQAQFSNAKLSKTKFFAECKIRREKE